MSGRRIVQPGLLLAATLLVWVTTALADPPAAAPLQFTPGAGSQVALKGTATIGAWNSQSSEIHGQVTLDLDAAALNALFDRVEAAGADDDLRSTLAALTVRNPTVAQISLPVASLHGGNSGMDRDMRNALNAAQHPDITYVFETVQQAAVLRDGGGRPTALKLCIVGKMNMAGVARPITMDMTVRRDARGHFTVHAQTSLLMTDFGVTPPSALLGLIKADDRVTVTFDLDLVLADQPQAVRVAGQAVDAPSR